METAYSFGLIINPKAAGVKNDLSAVLNIDRYTTKRFDEIIERWIPLSFVMNSLDRSMGMKNSYPFMINETVKEKLNFLHETVRTKSNLENKSIDPSLLSIQLQ